MDDLILEMRKAEEERARIDGALPHAVTKLLNQALNENTGASRTSAMVLLHCYNSNFRFDVTELANLDSDFSKAAWTVLQGRGRAFGIEPHTVIKDGDDHFAALKLKWAKQFS